MGFIASWSLMFMRLVRSRALIWQLVKRDLVAAYKQSALGVFWIFLGPILGIISWVFMNYAGVVNPGDVKVPYPVFLLLGTTVWGLFMGFYRDAAASLSSDSALLLQVNFPHEALVVRQLAQTAIAMVVNMILLLVVLLAFGVRPHWIAMAFPLLMMPLFCLGAGLGMVVSVFSVVIRDVNRVVMGGLGTLMFVTPVIYSSEFQSEVLQALIWWNPLTYLVGGSRDLVLWGRVDHPMGYMWSILLSILVFLLSWRLFFLSEQKVVEKA